METAINQSHFGLHCRLASSEGCGQTGGAPISIQPLLLHEAEQIIRKILPIAVTIEDGRPGTDSEDSEGKTIEVARQPLNGNPEARNLLKWGNGRPGLQGNEDAVSVLPHWGSAYHAGSIMANRETTYHTGINGRTAWSDICFTVDNDRRAHMVIRTEREQRGDRGAFQPVQKKPRGRDNPKRLQKRGGPKHLHTHSGWRVAATYAQADYWLACGICKTYELTWQPNIMSNPWAGQPHEYCRSDRFIRGDHNPSLGLCSGRGMTAKRTGGLSANGRDRVTYGGAGVTFDMGWDTLRAILSKIGN
ncbi:hypothetical protein EDD17DRAFT_1509385 [Pisolithus thermaeus]|nr:hypothetical protein EDD17DRAFT_1509385 [Pisolithus thermaeus]